MNISLWQSGVLEKGAIFAVPISQRCCEDKNARRSVRRFPMKPHAFQPLFLQLSTKMLEADKTLQQVCYTLQEEDEQEMG